MAASLIHTPNLLDQIRGQNLIIDTCVIIDASKDAEFANFIRSLANDNCTFVSIQPVKDEFLSIADSSDEYKKLEKYLETLKIAFLSPNIENTYDEQGKDFSIALRRSKVNKPSYVDRLLLSIPYLYRKSPEKMFVITSNHRDVPYEFYDRVGFVTWDKGKEFTEIGLYEFNEEKFNVIIQ